MRSPGGPLTGVDLQSVPRQGEQVEGTQRISLCSVARLCADIKFLITDAHLQKLRA